MVRFISSVAAIVAISAGFSFAQGPTSAVDAAVSSTNALSSAEAGLAEAVSAE